MSKQIGSAWVREVLQNVFEGIICAAILAFVAGGTVAMGFPNVIASIHRTRHPIASLTRAAFIRR